jgi:hypothetical protein
MLFFLFWPHVGCPKKVLWGMKIKQAHEPKGRCVLIWWRRDASHLIGNGNARLQKSHSTQLASERGGGRRTIMKSAALGLALNGLLRSSPK